MVECPIVRTVDDSGLIFFHDGAHFHRGEIILRSQMLVRPGAPAFLHTLSSLPASKVVTVS